jgi:hypothetical protein
MVLRLRELRLLFFRRELDEPLRRALPETKRTRNTTTRGPDRAASCREYKHDKSTLQCFDVRAILSLSLSLSLSQALRLSLV